MSAKCKSGINGSSVKESILGVDIFSTGHVSALCGVAPRTVSKWIDSGRLEGYRIPESNDRRVFRGALVTFLMKHQMTESLRRLNCPTAPPSVCLLIGLEANFAVRLTNLLKWTVICPSLFSAGMYFSMHRPEAVVIDGSVSKSEVVAATEIIKKISYEGSIVVVLANEDDPNDIIGAINLRKPVSIESIQDAVNSPYRLNGEVRI